MTRSFQSTLMIITSLTKTASLQSKVNLGKILVTILASFFILLGFLSVTGKDYNLFWDILATVYAYSADW